MPGPLLVHVHGGVREGAGDVADAAGVVEVDVGDSDASEIRGCHVQLAERSQQRVDRRLASRLDQDGLGPFDQVAGGDVVPAAEQRVDLDDARPDPRVHGFSLAPMQQPMFTDEPTYSVAELSSGIGAVLSRAFPDEVWVQGEIANISRPPSGHVYFDLVGDGCSLAVTLWATDRQVVNAVLRRAGGAVRMTDGTEVRIRVSVSWYAERGRVSLRMLSIDTAYTLGRLAEARELLLNNLAAEGLLRRQDALEVPPVPLRVALITSDGSAAAHDFLRTLEASGHAWKVTLLDARVQGVEAEPSILAALDAACRAAPPFDAVCLVRGGGARTDLAVFDREAVARAIALAPVPVWTGIGHELDTTVADAVANRSFRTPTACAVGLVEQVARWRDRLGSTWDAIARAANQHLR